MSNKFKQQSLQEYIYFTFIYKLMFRMIKLNKIVIKHRSLIFSRKYRLSKLNKNEQKISSYIQEKYKSKRVKYSLENSLLNLADDSSYKDKQVQNFENIYSSLNVKKDQLQSILQDVIKDLQQIENNSYFPQNSGIKISNIIDSYREIIKENNKILERSMEDQIKLDSGSFYFDYLLQFLKNKQFSKMSQKKKLITSFEIMIKLKCCFKIFQNYKTKRDIQLNGNKNIRQKCTFEKVKGKNRLHFQYLFTKKILHVATAANVLKQNYQNDIIKNVVFLFALPWYFLAYNQSKLLSLTFYQNPSLLLTQNLCNIPQQRFLKHLSNLVFQGIQTNIELYIPANGDDNMDIFQKNENAIVVRLLHREKIKRYSYLRLQEKDEQKQFKQVIVHIHGGGFIALSSSSSQNFTRRWSNTLDLPVFSIDYRMPPEHPFPTAPLDCYKVYHFLVHHIHKYLNIQPQQNIIAGDSAGGNLACSLTALILKHKDLKPKGLYLVYPALDLRLIFTSSRMHTFTDPLLQPSMLLLCLHAYLGDIQKSNDPLASPILLTQGYIKGSKDERFPLDWPRTIITVGDKDPMYDDSLQLMQRMVQSNINCQCIIYQQLTHGYLNMALFIKECQKTVDHSVHHLRRLIKPKNTNDCQQQ